MPVGIYERKFNEIIKAGDKFNRLTAIKFVCRGKINEQLWLFKCDCGKEKIMKAGRVKNGYSKSCGCLAIELTKKRNKLKDSHRMSKTKIYGIWMAMKERCRNKKCKGYKNYGSRGIKVCDRWLNSFENFYKDMGERPKGKSLDRIDNNGNYTPENCRWATPIEQGNNMRKNRLLTYNGKTLTVTQWSRIIGINNRTIFDRISRRLEIEKILSSTKYLGNNQYSTKNS